MKAPRYLMDSRSIDDEGKPMSSAALKDLADKIPYRQKDQSLLDYCLLVAKTVYSGYAMDFHIADEETLARIRRRQRLDFDHNSARVLRCGFVSLFVRTFLERIVGNRNTDSRLYDALHRNNQLMEFQELFLTGWLFPQDATPPLIDVSGKDDRITRAERYPCWWQSAKRLLNSVRQKMGYRVYGSGTDNLNALVVAEQQQAYRPMFDITQEVTRQSYLRSATHNIMVITYLHDVGFTQQQDSTTSIPVFAAHVIRQAFQQSPDYIIDAAHTHVRDKRPEMFVGVDGPPRSTRAGSMKGMVAGDQYISYFSGISSLRDAEILFDEYADYLSDRHSGMTHVSAFPKKATLPPVGGVYRALQHKEGTSTDPDTATPDQDAPSPQTEQGAINLATETTRSPSDSSIDKLTSAIKEATLSTHKEMTHLAGICRETSKQVSSIAESFAGASAKGRPLLAAVQTRSQSGATSSHTPPPSDPHTLAAEQISASAPRDRGRRMPRKPLHQLFPMTPWESLPGWIVRELARVGISDAQHPHYCSPEHPDRAGCVACGSKNHTVGWCPSVVAWTPKGDKWRDQLREAHRAKQLFSTPALFFASAEDAPVRMQEEEGLFRVCYECDDNDLEQETTWDVLDGDVCFETLRERAFAQPPGDDSV